MQTTVTFKNIDPSDNLKAYVSDKLDRFDKFLDNPAEASVVLSVEKFRHIAEIKITGDRLNINGKEETNDMYSAIDMVLDKLEKQIKKNKQKTRERRGGAKARVVDAIAGAPKFMHTVIEAQCTGCELCLSPCPVDCIEIRPRRDEARLGGRGQTA